MTENSDALIFEIKGLREQQSTLEKRQDRLDIRIDDLSNRTKDSESRLDDHDEKLTLHLTDLKRIEMVKATRVQFFEEMDRINEHMQNEDVEMKRIDDHLIALDQYLDKYQPVRMEDMITEHLDSCLTGD